MNKKLIRIIVTALLLVGAIVVEKTTNLPVWQLLLVYLVPYLLISYDIIAESAEGIVEGEPFNEDLLMTIATFGALLIGFLPGAETQFPEAVFIMLFFQIGEMFEDYAEDKNRDSIAHLMDIRPESATVVRNGAETEVTPDEVAVGEIIVIKAGDKVPLDGVVEEGSSSLNTVALTGESMPRSVAEGDTVLSGTINISGTLKVRVTKAYAESTVTKILDLVENAQQNKSKSETFITRFARIYT
ncbi:MAG: HAD-IC family P-type ATPase, partial [Bacteroidales bacterium]|nr:HAD-IC family P-type ATPase [Bacteroidales bacterium]